MNKTNIEWCDSTWNPVTGCRHGCEYCYARRIAKRFGGYDLNGRITTHNPLPRAELSEPLTVTRANGKTINSPIPLASSLRSTATGLRSRSTSRSRRPSSYAAWLICLAHGCRHAGLWKCWTLVGRPRSTAICSSQKTRPDTRSWIDSPCYRVKKTFGLV